jgi:26 proteasome complex subunit DSS1
MSGDRAAGADHLWEDNWDDDDIEDDFSLALRCVRSASLAET